jgi:outer membrane lipoprotein LolB
MPSDKSQACGQGFRLVLLGVCAALLSACAQLPPTSATHAPNAIWSGRLSLQVQTDPPQSLTAGFELKGSPVSGELVLNSPLGNTLLAARWSPLETVLYSSGQTRSFSSIDALIEQSTGAALPVAALFDWVGGKATSLNGWTADLQRQAEGRISARRSSPLPQAELRIVLDKPIP